MNHICVRYKKEIILSDVTLALEPGKAYGVFSKNGVGKTTMLKVLSGLYKADSGVLDYREDTGIGYSIDDSLLIEGLTVGENITYYAKLNGCSHMDDRELDGIVSLTGIRGYLDKRAGRLSKGMKQRTSLALSMIGYPNLLILDEAVSGVDAASRRQMDRKLRNLVEKKDVCLVFADHDVSNLAAICDEVIFLKDNSEVELRSVQQLTGGSKTPPPDFVEQVFLEVLLS